MNARELAAGAAMTFGVIGAVSAWADCPDSCDVPDGRTDVGAYIVKPLTDAAAVSVSAGDRECEIMRLQELCIASVRLL